MQSVTAYGAPFADAYNNDAMEDPLAYLNAYDSSYKEESAEYSQNTQDEEELPDNPWDTSRDMPEPEAEEDTCGYESDAPEHPDATENPEMPEGGDEEYNWPTTGMAGPIAKEIGRAHV